MQALLEHRLRAIDAMFLYLEGEHQPMNVGAVCVFEGRMLYRSLIKHVRDRLYLIPRYRQRVMPAPFNLGHPTWEEDPEFDVRNHVFQHSLPAPGGEAQLKDLAGRIFAGTLERDRPLWQLHLVRGLAGNRCALISKVHHCMVDGVAGVELASVLFDWTPEVTRLPPGPPFNPMDLPHPVARLYSAFWDNLTGSITRLTRLQHALASFGLERDAAQVLHDVRQFARIMGNFLLPLKKLPFNRPLDTERRIAWRSFPFAETHDIGEAGGATLNDVALTLVSGAIRRYVKRHPAKGWKRLPRTIRVLVPVNVRAEDEREACGNRISFLPVEVPLRVACPRERLLEVKRVMDGLKEARVATAINLMLDSLEALPVITQACSLAAIAQPGMQQLLSRFTAIPPTNMVCTNVPGPPIPLYLLGRRMTALYPTLPVCLEMGVNFAITSYDQTLYITVTGDGQAGGDVELLAAYLEESFLELQKAATGGQEGAAASRKPPARAKSNGNTRAAAGRSRPKSQPAAKDN